MARNDTATADAPVDGVPAEGEQAQAPADGTAEADKKAAAKAKRQNRNTYTVPVTVPMELYNLLKTKADDSKTSIAQTARTLLAGYVEYTMPVNVIKTRTKYASPEDRKAAVKDRNQKANALLAALDSGEIDPSILEKFLAAQKAAKATAEVAPATDPAAEAVPA